MSEDQEQPKRSRGRPRKFGRRQNFNFRLTDELRGHLTESARNEGRSLSEEIEFRVNRAFEWERVLGDLEAFKARVAEAQRQTEAAERYRAGWAKMYNPNVPGGFEWLAPGTHNIPPGGFVDQNAPPPPTTLPPALAEAVRVEVKSAVKDLLEEAGLLGRKKKSA